ncbi:lysosomal alpha-glucosidase-like [Centruroides vittatus]|uniref:lysosomal alpha-glucosidase-like n=1 Tax=Centruroides vittatus TaxID=120091 RepID=UPI00351098EB
MTSQSCCVSSTNLRCLALTSVVFSLVCIFMLSLYYLILRDEGAILEREAGLFSQPQSWHPICSLPEGERFDCYPEDGEVLEEMCSARGCCWDNSTKTPIKCFYSKNHGYRMIEQKSFQQGIEILLTRLPSPSRYGDHIHHVKVRVEMQTSTRLRVKFFDSENERYEVPTPKIPVEPSFNPVKEKNPLYGISYDSSDGPFSLEVHRAGTDNTIFRMSGHGFVFSDQFLQITLKLPSENLYGLGEHFHSHYKHDMKWKNWTLFSSYNQDQIYNMASVNPSYMCVEKDGKAHGVLLFNSNALEVSLLPTPAVTFRAIGGVLDFYFFLGPTPEEVVQQYTLALGRPTMPPYWALGFHLGFQQNGQILKKLHRMRSKDVSHDVLHLEANHIDDLSLIMDQIQKLGLKLLVVVSPEIYTELQQHKYFYRNGLEKGIFINDTWGYPFIAKGRYGNVVFPDFGKPATEYWWQDRIRKLSVIPFDGIWLENNIPVNLANDSEEHCYPDSLNEPPYLPKIDRKHLYEGTLCMDSVQHWKQTMHYHYYMHNLYGHLSIISTYNALKALSKNKRNLIISQSTFAGSGKYSGHQIKHPFNQWEDMKNIIPLILQFSLFGIPYVGFPLCSCDRNYEEELCIRNIQLGAFYPLIFSHVFEDDQLCSSRVDMEYVTRQSLRRRYELLPYLYTLFHLANVHGSTVARPLFHQFPQDPVTYDIDQQFLWGDSLMISPVVEKGSIAVKAYFPKSLWYDYYNGKGFESVGEWIILQAPLDRISRPVNLHVLGGQIIPTQQAANTTSISRKNPMGLVIALNASNQAVGELFWDDGELKDSISAGEYIKVKFSVSQNTLTVKEELGKNAFRSSFRELHIQYVRLMGLKTKPLKITIDDNYILAKEQYKWDEEYQFLQLQQILIPLTGKTVIEWFL